MSKWQLFLAAAPMLFLWAFGVQNQPKAEPDASSPSASASAAPAASTGNGYNDQLLGMSERDRSGIFQKLMQGSDERCPSVERTFYQGIDVSSGQAFWNVDCGGKDWIVSIDRQSSTRLLECSVAARLGTTECWIAFKRQGA